nr:hypothetical protein [Nannocystis pusilla]
MPLGSFFHLDVIEVARGLGDDLERKVEPDRQANDGLEHGVGVVAEQRDDVSARHTGSPRQLLLRDAGLHSHLLEQVDHVDERVPAGAAELALRRFQLSQKDRKWLPAQPFQHPRCHHIDVKALAPDHPPDVLS